MSNKPLYYAIVREFEEKIKNGTLISGKKLPSERELCAQYNISRGTARNVFATLEQQGLCERVHGSGTYVGCSHIRKAEKGLCDSMIDEMVELGICIPEILETAKRQAWNRLAKDERPIIVWVAEYPATYKNVIQYISERCGLFVDIVLFDKLEIRIKELCKSTRPILFSVSSQDYDKVSPIVKKINPKYEICRCVCVPDMETVKKLVMIPREAKVTIIHGNDQFYNIAARKVREFCRSAEIIGMPLANLKAANKNLNGCIVISADDSNQLPEKADLLNGCCEKIVFSLMPDNGSIDVIIDMAVKLWIRSISV